MAPLAVAEHCESEEISSNQTREIAGIRKIYIKKTLHLKLVVAMTAIFRK